MNCRKNLAALIGISLLVNATFTTIGMAKSVDETPIVSVKNYDPFSKDDNGKVEENLSVKEKIKKALEENQVQKDKSAVEGVEKGHIYIPQGTKLKVELIEEATSKKMKKNEIVEFRMVDNLIINGVVVIPKGAVGNGYVYEVQKAGGFGRKGVLRIAGKEIKTINNISVPLKQGIQGKGNTDGGAVAVAVAVSFVGGLFMKGSNITYPAGTDFEVEVRNNVDLEVFPENLVQSMNPNVPRGIEIQVFANK